MASKRRIRRKICEGKVKYATDEDAKRAAAGASHKEKLHISPYKCKFCGGWHIGHTPKQIRWQMIMKNRNPD